MKRAWLKLRLKFAEAALRAFEAEMRVMVETRMMQEIKIKNAQDRIRAIKRELREAA